MVGVREVFSQSKALELSLPESSSCCSTVSKVNEVPLNILTIVGNSIISIGITTHLHVTVVISGRVIVKVRMKEYTKSSVTKSRGILIVWLVVYCESELGVPSVVSASPFEPTGNEVLRWEHVVASTD